MLLINYNSRITNKDTENTNNTVNQRFNYSSNILQIYHEK